VNEQSWDGANYNVQDSQGTLGTITFAGDSVVAAFFDAHSSRNPFSHDALYKLEDRLAEMPPDLRAIAEQQTLQYLLQDYQGSETPVITSCFWSEAANLVAGEPWEAVLNHGAHLVRVQLLPVERAVQRLQVQYEFSTAEVGLLRSLFDRKLAAGNSLVTMTTQDKELLTAKGSTGIEQALELLDSIATRIE
jgi:hypothetical protein